MDFIAPIIFYIIIAALLFLTYKKNKDKFHKSLKISFKSGKDLTPILIVIVIFLTFANGFLNGDFINKYISIFSGVSGIFGAAILGSIVHVPAFIAFPIGGQILKSGVNAGIIAVLINTLIMVHTFTIPIEVKEMGWKFAIVRNGFSLISAIIIGVLIGVIY